MKTKFHSIFLGFISTFILITACFCNAFFTECTVTNISAGDLSMMPSHNSVQQEASIVVTDKQAESIDYTAKNINTEDYVSNNNTVTSSVTGAFKDAFVYLFEHINPESK